MATAQNTNNTKLASPPKAGREELLAGNISGNNTAKQTYTTLRYGNDHGSISFGHIHKQGDVTADVMIQASDSRQSIVLDKDGPRKGCTQITAPGRISIESGFDKEESEDTLFIHSHNGNIDIIATNGKLRLQGTDIELIAVGEGGSKGNIRMKANQNIELDAPKIVVNAKTNLRLFTPGTLQMSANSCMEIYSAVIRGVTDACANRDSKVGGRNIQRQNNK
jgi:lipopolysaccharide assembly outer membrane protein LptD (OstA)